MSSPLARCVRGGGERLSTSGGMMQARSGAGHTDPSKWGIGAESPSRGGGCACWLVLPDVHSLDVSEGSVVYIHCP